MTTPTQPPPVAAHAESREAALRAATRRFHHVTAPLKHAPVSRVVQGYHTVWDEVAPWMDLARQRLADAADSAADSARWLRLIATLTEPVGRKVEQPTFEGFLALCVVAGDLFKALLDAERPGPTVAELADQIHRAVKEERYWPGLELSVKRLAAEHRATKERVALALRDLSARGIVVLSPAGRASVPAPSGDADHPTEIARWLTTLVEHGVYPADGCLPPHGNLARSLVSSVSHVNTALRQLRRSGLLNVRSGGPATVAGAPARLVDIQSVITQARSHPSVPATPARIRASATAARQWWLHRDAPPPEKAELLFRTLQGMTAALLPAAPSLTALSPEAREAVLRAAVTATAPLPGSPQERTWRTACLGAALLDVLARVRTGNASGRETSTWGGPR
jgi:DNA-binding FadR family transcriptional regulator